MQKALFVCRFSGKVIVEPKNSSWKPTAKIEGPIRPTNAEDECDTRLQRRCLRAADRILAKAGFFQKPEDEFDVLDANCIGAHGLKPIWHGSV